MISSVPLENSCTDCHSMLSISKCIKSLLGKGIQRHSHTLSASSTEALDELNAFVMSHLNFPYYNKTTQLGCSVHAMEANGFSVNCLAACLRLLDQVGAAQERQSPYAEPYVNYVMSWCSRLPLKTIFMGQNPYPRDIYPLFGSALSYDEKKCSDLSVFRSLSYDPSNYDGTSIEDSVECFKNSWHTIESGTIFINETVFSKITDTGSNVRNIREVDLRFEPCKFLWQRTTLWATTNPRV